MKSTGVASLSVEFLTNLYERWGVRVVVRNGTVVGFICEGKIVEGGKNYEI
ncbi:hypothetical protein P9274_20055 [Schinkia azotoformans]|uniref:hypothetical protein n=1 Tax=Schinkia azotoformans TaxID=1454 RepID=UPI002E1E78CC|nr:hypothetical protein [Schinkia azotoformans]